MRAPQIWETISDSFWFLPLLMAICAAGVAFAGVAFDHSFGRTQIEEVTWLWSGGADGARSVLSVVAASAMTVISIVFSLTVTSLAQTSSHYGPLVLRNFTSDRLVQFTMGTFVSTFVYCLLVLRTVRSIDESNFVPFISVTFGLVLALFSVGVLILFIHHISQIIQADNLIARVAQNFETSLDLFFPSPAKQATHETEKHLQSSNDTIQECSHTIISDVSGYLQGIDEINLLQLATQNDLIFKVEKRPGTFVAAGSVLVSVNHDQSVHRSMEKKIKSCFSIGRHRTAHQDLLYVVQQFVEIAVHALSPGINEPFTAISCIDWLGASLLSVTQRDLPDPFRYDSAQNLRIITPVLNFEVIAGAAFDQIRLYGASNPDVCLSLLAIIAQMAPTICRDSDNATLANHAHLIGIEASSQIACAADRARVEIALKHTTETLSARYVVAHEVLV